MSKEAKSLVETGRIAERADVLEWLVSYAKVTGGDPGNAVLAAAEVIMDGRHEGLALLRALPPQPEKGGLPS